MVRRTVALFALAVVFSMTQAHAACTSYEEAVAALEASRNFLHEQNKLWHGEPKVLRERLAKHPPGPGWISFGWSKSMDADDPEKLLNLLISAKDLGLLGRRDKASRLILCDIALRYEQGAHALGD